jgi:hypothetical protein
MNQSQESRVMWRTSSYSNGSGGNCVQVASRGHAIAVRDSKDRHGPTLTVTPGAWAEFTKRLKASQNGG